MNDAILQALSELRQGLSQAVSGVRTEYAVALFGAPPPIGGDPEKNISKYSPKMEELMKLTSLAHLI